MAGIVASRKQIEAIGKVVCRIVGEPFDRFIEAINGHRKGQSPSRIYTFKYLCDKHPNVKSHFIAQDLGYSKASSYQKSRNLFDAKSFSEDVYKTLVEHLDKTDFSDLAETISEPTVRTTPPLNGKAGITRKGDLPAGSPVVSKLKTIIELMHPEMKAAEKEAIFALLAFYKDR